MDPLPAKTRRSNLRQSQNSAFRANDLAEKREFGDQQRRRLHFYKMAFFAVVISLQSVDLISDLVAEISYFTRESKVGGSHTNGTNGTASLNHMGAVFDVCYGLHFLFSLAVSFLVLKSAARLFRHLRSQQRATKGDGEEQRQTPSTSPDKVRQVSGISNNKSNGIMALQRAANELAGEKRDDEGGSAVREDAGVSSLLSLLSLLLPRKVTP